MRKRILAACALVLMIAGMVACCRYGYVLLKLVGHLERHQHKHHANGK